MYLSEAEKGEKLKITAVRDAEIAARLNDLGVTVGSVVYVCTPRRYGSTVIRSGMTEIALGKDAAKVTEVEFVDEKRR